MNQSWITTETAKYTFYGVLFGFLFPILATSFDLYRYQLDFSWKSAFELQRTYPIHFIIDTAPVFLGLFAGFGGYLMDRLKEKNRQLLKSSKFRQDFLANMSHEIRTPMVGVIGMIDLLFKTTDLDTVQKEYVHTIHQSSQNLLDILNQILDLSKLEAGKFSFAPEPTNLKKLILQNTSLFSANCKAKNIALITDFEEQLPVSIEIDKHRLTQVLSNLVSNAIKFTKQGNITIKVSQVAKTNNTSFILKIEVIDTGIGISKKDQKALFSRFSQLQNNKILTSAGSGLGLTICKKLVDLMKGELGVISKVNEGSNFWFTFKTEISSVDRIEDVKKIDANQYPKYGLHILVVEDSETNILVTNQILKYLGCTTKIAKNGKEAVEIFKENTFDLILMDINLPELDGVQTTEIIRNKFKKIPPIIAITSNALPGDAERFTSQGLDDYITKPFTTETIHIKLKNWFGDHHEYH